ncbi:MAG: DUF3168 domain-containing protein [Parvibaculaceae bacterium]|nr:DUF3168 domain-containing protein [Parvibaculaceae bacterium]
MSMTSLWPLQKALYARLSVNSDVITTLGGAGLYDEVPVAALYPYVTFGSAASTPLGEDACDSAEHKMTLDVWSQRRGSGQAKQVLSALAIALEEESLTLTGAILVNLQVTKITCDWDQEDLLTRGSLVLRAVTQGM